MYRIVTEERNVTKIFREILTANMLKHWNYIFLISNDDTLGALSRLYKDIQT